MAGALDSSRASITEVGPDILGVAAPSPFRWHERRLKFRRKTGENEPISDLTEVQTHKRKASQMPLNSMRIRRQSAWFLEEDQNLEGKGDAL